MTVQPKDTTTANLDPFFAIPLFSRARNLNSWLIMLPIGIVLISLILVASAIDGTIGSWHDFQFWADLKRALNVPHISGSEPDFPVMRDVTSWILAFLVVLSCGISHRQWQLIARSLSDLARNGVLTPKTELSPSFRSRVLRFDHFIGSAKGHAAFNAFINNLNKTTAAKIAKWAPYIAALSAIIVILLIIGEKHTLFIVFAPRGLDSSRRSSWLSAAYESWWASDNHPAGLLAYFIGCFLGAYVLVVVNIIGLVVVYLVAALPYLAEFDIDWLNRDGDFGWLPVKRIFRTVYALLTLNGCIISILLIVLGIQNFPWIIIIVALWIAVVPLYTIVTTTIFGTIVDQARKKRINELTHFANDNALLSVQNVNRFRLLVLELDRVRTAKIRPASPGWLQTPSFVVAVLLPIILTAAQILFSGGFLSH
jgi:hypothetical protein